MREVRLALLAADVNYQVAKDFCEEVKTKAMGAEVLASIRPGEQFVKIVHDELLAIFGSETTELTPNRPLRILLCGLNGAGKTTTAGKLAAWFKKQKQHVVLVAGDLARPAAIEQLQILGKQIGVTVLTFPGEKSPGERRASWRARKSRACAPRSPSSMPPAGSMSMTRCSRNSKPSARRGSRRKRCSSPTPPRARPR